MREDGLPAETLAIVEEILNNLRTAEVHLNYAATSASTTPTLGLEEAFEPSQQGLARTGLQRFNEPTETMGSSTPRASSPVMSTVETGSLTSSNTYYYSATARLISDDQPGGRAAVMQPLRPENPMAVIELHTSRVRADIMQHCI